MFKLIYKDLYQLRKPYLLYSGMLLGLLMLADSFASGAFLALYLVIAVYGLTLRSAYYEDKDNALTFLRTLPIQAKTIVIAKYVTVTLLLLLVGLFALAVAAVFHLMGTPLESGLLSFCLLATAGIMVLVSVFLAVFFRWGYNRAVNTIRFLFLSLFFIPIIISRFSQVLRPQNSNLVETLGRVITQPLFPYLMALLVLGIYLISMLFSIREFKVG